MTRSIGAGTGILLEGWFDEDVIGIDKGIVLLMIENYRTGLVLNLMNKNKYVQTGLKRVGLMDGSG
ncbi:glucoamylase family protein [Paenibacillus apiarius]|uniref:glucoamylase family protein n=1 Tax=Paenibacillus apiarius TaxID=46240 RepID=UPI001980E0B0|nr:glucoamylase family protein [Paenibacillus apiarius]MBN3527608.1 hypothetical protein [Paenibacillus apiarius]